MESPINSCVDDETYKLHPMSSYTYLEREISQKIINHYSVNNVDIKKTSQTFHIEIRRKTNNSSFISLDIKEMNLKNSEIEHLHVYTGSKKVSTRGIVLGNSCKITSKQIELC